MRIDIARSVVTRRPGLIVGSWVLLAGFVGLAAPDLTRLAAEGQAHLINEDAESARGAGLIRDAWPDQSYESSIVLALHRRAGLTPADRAFARGLAGRFDTSKGHPTALLRVLGPASRPEVAARLLSKDHTLELIVAQLSTSFVAPAAKVAFDWLQAQAADPSLRPPEGLALIWTGDAAIGRDYMANVQISLDRAALATMVLLLGVLMVVYRSFRLALIPLVTIGICLVIARGALAWLSRVGWEISPLVELFLIVVLFGSGTDFCLFVSWRFAEQWDPKNPEGAMRVTLRRGAPALLTSAGTVFVGLMLMGTTHFKLFATTGPSVALGLVITVAASLTLAPALLLLLARWRPEAFRGMTAPSTGFWEHFAHRILARPMASWLGALILMVPLAILGTRTYFTQDTLLELPAGTPSVGGLRLVAEKFGPGIVAPLTVLLRSDSDLRSSSGLAMVDDVSRMLGRQPFLDEVRSATQPLGSPAVLDPARLSNRLAAVNAGFRQIEAGADQLREGLDLGLSKLRAARWIQENTGLKLTPGANPGPSTAPSDPKASQEALSNGFREAGTLLFHPGSLLTGRPRPAPAPTHPAVEAPDATAEQLAKAVAGAGQLSDGVRQASKEIATILDDPVGRLALDRLLITPQTVRDHPELADSFQTYFTPDGKMARLDVLQGARMFSTQAVDEVLVVRRKLQDRIDEEAEPKGVQAVVAGPNAESADIRTMTRGDQVQSWFVVPLGVLVILILALRDFLACANLVATMLLTYLFALGATHLVFVTILGAEGLDWKVPYFLFVLLVAVGVDYNVFLMTRLQEEASELGLRAGIGQAVAQTGGLITSAAAITAVSFASFLFSPLSSLRQLGFALVIGIAIDALLVRPLLVPCGQWLLHRRSESQRLAKLLTPGNEPLVPASN